MTVASKSSSKVRSEGAAKIIARLREKHTKIVEQAILISHEIIRVAILWNELWHEGLEEASRIFFTEKNPEGMIAALEPLHQLMEEVIFYSLSSEHACSQCSSARTSDSQRDILYPDVWKRLAISKGRLP